MKTLLEIKNEVAQENKQPNWSELLYWGSSLTGFRFPDAIDEVAKRYASQFIDAAAHKSGVQVNYHWGQEAMFPHEYKDDKVTVIVDFTSILKLKEQLK